jgi:hypothetical protein
MRILGEGKAHSDGFDPTVLMIGGYQRIASVGPEASKRFLRILHRPDPQQEHPERILPSDRPISGLVPKSRLLQY